MSGFEGIVISGASRGLGAALALRLAGPGVRMLLVARSEAALRAVAAECAARGARPRIAALDVRDAPALAAALAGFEAEGPVDLVVANAGTSAGTGADGAPLGLPPDVLDMMRKMGVTPEEMVNQIAELMRAEAAVSGG
jgi:NADP-dependent 3-hydroxy acid dehydrogenase YdfG